MNLTTEQLAQILIGIARSQQAIIDAMESLKAGFKGTYLAPALDSAAKIRSTGRPMTLRELPARVLMQCQGRAGPNTEQLIRDLEELLAAAPPTAIASAPATMRSIPQQTGATAPLAAAVENSNDLDMTK